MEIHMSPMEKIGLDNQVGTEGPIGDVCAIR